jgi:hypothetical protein
VPYTAILCQDYKDDITTKVDIEGVLIVTALANLTVAFQPPRFIATDLPAPTTTTTSTTTSTTTTAPTTTAKMAVNDSGAFGLERTFRSSRPESDSHLAALPPPLPPTLFPPTEPTSPTPNPLRQFYPVEDDSAVMVSDEAVRAAQVSDLAAAAAVNGGRASETLLLFLFVLSSYVMLY